MKKIYMMMRMSLILLISLFGISFTFINSTVIQNFFLRIFDLKIDPRFTGGPTAAEFYDPKGDDYGTGTFIYPRHPSFTPGLFDILRFAVHEPVYSAQWQKFSEYWQFDIEFASGGESDMRYVEILAGFAQGTTGETAADTAVPADTSGAETQLRPAGVRTDSSFPYTYAVTTYGGKSFLTSADGTITAEGTADSVENGRKLIIRIPLEKRSLHHLYNEKDAYFYVYTCAYSQLDRNNVLPVQKRASRTAGGGSPHSLAPFIYDILLPEGMDQKTVLSSWDEDALEKPLIFPVTAKLAAGAITQRRSGNASGGSSAAGGSIASSFEERKNASAQLIEKSSAEKKKKAAAELMNLEKALETGNAEADLNKFARAAFTAGNNEKAEKYFDEILASSPDDAAALAYKGSITAKKGSGAPVLTAVAMVNKAYEYLDRAASLALSNKNMPAQAVIEVLINRGSVSQSVPNEVFLKAEQGAQDFLKAAEYACSAAYPAAGTAAGENIMLRAQLYFSAAECYELSGNLSQANIWYRESIRLLSIPQ